MGEEERYKGPAEEVDGTYPAWRGIDGGDGWQV